MNSPLAAQRHETVHVTLTITDSNGVTKTMEVPQLRVSGEARVETSLIDPERDHYGTKHLTGGVTTAMHKEYDPDLPTFADPQYLPLRRDEWLDIRLTGLLMPYDPAGHTFTITEHPTEAQT